MKLVTVATHDSGYYQALYQSAKNNGFDLVTLGLGKPWNGFMMKIKEVLEYVKKLQKDEVVSYVDAYDCLVLGTAQELKSKYDDLHTDKIIFSASHGNILGHMFFGTPADIHRDKFYNALCAGVFIGKAGKIQALFSRICEDYDCNDKNLNDQLVLTEYHKRLCRECIDLDTSCSMFYNIDFNENAIVGLAKIYLEANDRLPLNTKLYHFDGKRIYVHKTNSVPVILHGNGNLNLDNFIEALGFPPKLAKDRNYKAYSSGTYLKTFLQKTALYLVYFIHLLLFIIGIIGPLIFNEPHVLLALLFWYILLITQWYLTGMCILTPLEESLSGSSQNVYGGTNKSKSFIVDVTEKTLHISQNTLYYILSLVPLVGSTIVLLKLYYRYNFVKLH